ncbi:MAG TPA: hypothetical protein VL994_12195 [Steroidobacteraceae bacterium]|nr:hypothetical protein [Steroidobacteraceae bacterium]
MLLRFPARRRPPGRAPEDRLSVHEDVERGAPFCSNPLCGLNLRLPDARIQGAGNWVSLPDGRVFGRNCFGETLLCDACGTGRGPVRLSARASAG